MTDKERLYVSTIAECKSITKASEILFIAQPSLTQALHRIESEYGVSFFERGRKGLRLTEAGQAYLTATERIERIYQEMEYEIGAVSGNQRGRINLGITSFQGSILLPDFLIQYSAKFPLMDLKLFEASSSQLELLASDNRLDVILLHRPFGECDLNYISLYREPFYLAVSPQNPDYLAAAAKEGEIPLLSADILSRQQMIMLSSNQRISQVSGRICAAAGVSPKIRFSTISFITALGLAAKGMGATFVPASYARFFSYPGNQLALFRLPGEWNGNWELVAAYGKQQPLSKSCLELIRVVQECIASSPEIF